jgi:hypothetical protein
MPLFEGFAELPKVSVCPTIADIMAFVLVETYLARQLAQAQRETVFLRRVEFLNRKRPLFHLQQLRTELIRVPNNIRYPLLHC